MKDQPEHAVDEQWAAVWLDAVASGASAMSQRKLSSVQKHGGLEHIGKAAAARGVHLVLLTDDKGQELIAASKHPFVVIC